jgi:osmotically-inducible protein OsmY
MNRTFIALCCLGSLFACSQQPQAQHAELTPASAERAPESHPPQEPGATQLDSDRTSGTSSPAAADPNLRPAAGSQPLPGTHADTRAPDARATAANSNAADATKSNAANGSSAPLMPPASDGPNADNTQRNERDRDSSAITPIDQGNNESDLKITQQIRQAVMSDKSLSFNAKNAKIITVNGKVTLRGTVATDGERTAIGNAAARVVGPTQVDNLLEVKK